MPEAFEQCARMGGKIRTRSLPDNKHQKICVRPGGKKGPRGGRTVGGNVQKNKAQIMTRGDH